MHLRCHVRLVQCQIYAAAARMWHCDLEVGMVGGVFDPIVGSAIAIVTAMPRV